MQKIKPTGGRRSFGKVSKKMAEMSVIKITCGLVKAQLHKNKFYCPGIHRECIEYNGSFITPKMFSVMGDKEKLKDWKNAIRINGIQVRKYIESGTLDFYRHDEFCTGRCIARSPLNRSMQANAAAADLKVEYVSSINEHTYCHLRDDSEAGLQLPTVEMTSDPVPVDVKPNVALLQSLLEKPLTSVDGVPPDVAAVLANQKFMAEEEEPIDCSTERAEEDRQFWIGIMELGLLEHFFREIKITLDSFKSDLVTYHVRPKDAVRISNTVRNLGLMKRFKCRLSSFKSDMDLQQAKIDAEMTALKQKVTQYELRKEALKRKSEKFELLMDISSEKKFIIEKNIDNSDGEEQADVDDDDNNDEDDDNDDSDMEGVSVYMQENEDDEEEEGEDEEDTRDGFEVTEVMEEELQRSTVCEKRVSVPTTVHAAPKTSQPPAATTSRQTAVPQPRASVSTAVAHPGILGGYKKSTKAVSIPKSIPFNITTLPADSSSNYIIKNTSQISRAPADQSKKVTIVRQVLMETANDGDHMERIKEAAANSLKEISSTGPNNTAPEPSKSVAAPPKEKIRIIARYKSSVDSAPSIVKKPTVPHPQDASPAAPTTTSAMLTYNAATNSLCTVAHPAESATQKSSADDTEKMKTSPLPMVVVTDIKRRKMGPRCKTMFSVDFGSIGKAADQDVGKVTFDSGCQTPIDGIRENPVSEEDKDMNTAASVSRAKPAVGARRSNRKTAHMFSWGVKEGVDDSQKANESQDNTQLLTPEDLLNFSYQESPSLENV